MDARREEVLVVSTFVGKNEAKAWKRWLAYCGVLKMF
jgi:hypothetical protein